jgi:hypothetical protein
MRALGLSRLDNQRKRITPRYESVFVATCNFLSAFTIRGCHMVNAVLALNRL